jgi:hypothetical protein
MRRTILFSVVVLLLVAPLAGGASADKPIRNCPPSFDLGLLDKADELELDVVRAGLNADPPAYTVEQLAAVFDLVDLNGDGFICGKSMPSNTQLQYYFNGVDNTAVGPGS